MVRNTPENITTLGSNEIFVFGSNLAGRHGGGAARIAYEKFGAVWGIGVGLQGQSYAIPTMQGGVDTIKPYVDEFIRFARSNPGLIFYVTRIGCGIAGFSDQEIAPLFYLAIDVKNIVLPKEFSDIIWDIHSSLQKSSLIDVFYGDYIDLALENDGIREDLNNGIELPELLNWLYHRAINDNSKSYYTDNDMEFIAIALTIGTDTIFNWLHKQKSIAKYQRDIIEQFLMTLLKYNV